MCADHIHQRAWYPSRLRYPLLRVTSNTAIAKPKPGWVDYNACALMVGKDVTEAAEELCNMLLRVAGGEAQAVAEANWHRQIDFFRDGVTD